MLGDQIGGTPDEKWKDIKKGGQVLIGDSWAIVLRVNKTGGRIASVTATAPVSVTWRRDWKYGIEQVKDYRPPTEEQAAKVEAATKLPPMVNYPGEGFHRLTMAEWKAKPKDYKGTYIVPADSTHGAYRYRSCMHKPTNGERGDWCGMVSSPAYITDAKRVDPPGVAAPRPVLRSEPAAPPAPRPQREEDPKAAKFEALADTLKAGVQVVSAPQLFETPAALADRVIELAQIGHSDRILEPSAGTGRLIVAALRRNDCAIIQAVEINLALAERLRNRWGKGNYNVDVRCSDFLACNGELGQFDRIVMNPPFANGEDIKHIEHARAHLKPGGRLVAICANGPRQRDKLMPQAAEWIDLEPGAFAESGTNVNAAIVVIDAPANS